MSRSGKYGNIMLRRQAQEGGEKMRTGRIATGVAAVALLAMVNLGCAAKQPEDSWTAAAQRASAAAQQADASAARAETAARRAEAAATKVESAARRTEEAVTRLEAMVTKSMRK
ncbi:MAG: hypothetical protein ACREQ3_06725 [Candidatus Binatia bacterium]